MSKSVSLASTFLRTIIVSASLALCACESVPIVHQPMSARPDVKAATPPPNGSIFQVGFVERPLFEDRRARAIGDTLTVQITEKNNASKKSNTNLSKTGSVDFSVPLVQGLPGKGFQGAGLQANSSNKFDGK